MFSSGLVIHVHIELLLLNLLCVHGIQIRIPNLHRLFGEGGHEWILADFPCGCVIEGYYSFLGDGVGIGVYFDLDLEPGFS